MGLLQGLLQARKLLLVICVPLLLLPLPTIYPTSVSSSLPIPARASEGVGEQRREVWREWSVYGAPQDDFIMVEIVFIWMNLYFSTKVLSSLKLPFPSPCLKKGPPILASTEWETIAEMAVVLQKSAGAVAEPTERTGWGAPIIIIII